MTTATEAPTIDQDQQAAALALTWDTLPPRLIVRARTDEGEITGEVLDARPLGAFIRVTASEDRYRSVGDVYAATWDNIAVPVCPGDTAK